MCRQITNPYRFLHPENENSALRKQKFCAPKIEMLCSKLEIPCPENETFAHKNCSLNRNPRILHSANEDYVLRKWNFCT